MDSEPNKRGGKRQSLRAGEEFGVQKMVLVADRNADQSRSASPGVNFERETIFVLLNALLVLIRLG